MTSLNRNWLLCVLLLLLFSGPAKAAEELLAESLSAQREETETRWYNVKHLSLEGQGWSDLKSPFDRLPAKAEGVVRGPVWSLSRHSAGLCVRFASNSPSINVHWKLISASLAMPHMPATGVSGVDLYVLDAGGHWRWLATGRPTKQENTAQLAHGLGSEKRSYMLYLPLYNGVELVEVGVAPGSKLFKTTRAAHRQKPIIFYGTSITQGGCASRTGMVHTAILGRRLDRPVINLGFSGNGKMEPEMADLLAELDPAAYVLDCLPNMDGKMTAERVAPTVRTLRKARPHTPILLVEDRFYSDGFLNASRRQRNDENHKALKAAYQQLLKEGVTGLSYLGADHLLGDDNEGTVDGSHPTDLGFVRMSDAFEKALRPLLK